MTDLLVDIVVKVGGGLLAHPSHFNAVLTTIAEAACSRRLLVVPGGGPFADAVRQVDAEVGLSDDAAHWMAVLAMDQCSHLIASRIPAARVAFDRPGIATILQQGQLPVLAPSRWLHEADPLPHSWDVTSDSIAAWVAGAIGARRLLLIKPPGAADQLVDPYFRRIFPQSSASVEILPADQARGIRHCLAI